MELGMQASVNGALESVPAEGAVTAHVQVMLIQSLNAFFLMLQALTFDWFHALCVGGLLHSCCGGNKENNFLSHASSGAYLNHHIVFSSKINLLQI